MVPVATSLWAAKVSRLKRAQSSRSCFLLSWAMRAMVFRAPGGIRLGLIWLYTSVVRVGEPESTRFLEPRRYGKVTGREIVRTRGRPARNCEVVCKG